MKSFLPSVAIFSFLISGTAFADDFLATCKANPPKTGLPAGAPPNMGDMFCTCADTQTAANPVGRAELLASFKEPDLTKRMAMLSQATRDLIQKCSAP